MTIAKTLPNTDLETLRQRIPQMDFARGTPEKIALWREDIAESRTNLIIEGLIPTVDEDAMFAMMLEAGVPPSTMAMIIRGLYESDLTRVSSENPSQSR
ncbi:MULTISPECIES: hypothetical protein [unclassified Sphingomonas]|jgi:hypothetical protein|uniref:hypothetical protein n=1 Tax=unclassified Sphingomonas TaxID=196159 RepID=UPI000927C026|nr:MULTISPECIES: hypothetical protein [unclassified Sphingomonas]OJV29219.1 MAG: hypothetical protein BGO24_03430 [Sphingomonas sp. 67-36]